MRRLLLLASLLGTGTVGAQARSAAPAAPLPIQDNSFLVEEAYNQERGVVQHINSFVRTRGGGGWDYAFTQEWPVAGQRHQLSYTLPVTRTAAATGSRAGVGDVALNYRLQFGGTGGSAVAIAPRVTALLPTGASPLGLGAGGAGFQVNLPFSAVLPASLVVHSNAGMTYRPRARDTLGNRAATADFTLAQSVVWLTRPRFNVLLEAAWNRTREVAGPGRTERSTEVLLSPGIRGAFDFRSGLQIVPGIAFPIGVGPSRGERGVFVYLSFEHPFAK